MTDGPSYESTIVTRTTLTSSEALTALWALRHYREHVKGADWSEEKRAEVLTGVDDTIATLTKG